MSASLTPMYRAAGVAFLAVTTLALVLGLLMGDPDQPHDGARADSTEVR